MYPISQCPVRYYLPSGESRCGILLSPHVMHPGLPRDSWHDSSVYPLMILCIHINHMSTLHMLCTGLYRDKPVGTLIAGKKPSSGEGVIFQITLFSHLLPRVFSWSWPCIVLHQYFLAPEFEGEAGSHRTRGSGFLNEGGPGWGSGNSVFSSSSRTR